MRTANLRLIPLTPAHWLVLLEGAELFEQRFGLRSAGWVLDSMGAASPEFLARLRTATGSDSWRDGYFALLGDENLIVGACGYKGPPGTDGVVEIAYGVAPEFRCRGFATEMAEALTAHAFASGMVRLVCAHTVPEPNASTRVLQKCGFAFAGEVTDPDDGRVWRWEKRP